MSDGLMSNLPVASVKIILIGATVVLVVAIIAFVLGGVYDSVSWFILGAILGAFSLALYGYGYYKHRLDNFATDAVNAVAGLVVPPPADERPVLPGL